MDGLDFPRVGVLPSGQLDAITDVGDIRVGHCTLDEGNVHTGVTVVLPTTIRSCKSRLPPVVYSTVSAKVSA